MPSPGSIDPNSIPPTDAKIGGVGRAQITALHNKASERREVLMRSASLNTPQPDRTMVVVPVNGRVVFDLVGIPYPTGGACVPVDDVYVQRRLRDGSLVRIPKET